MIPAALCEPICIDQMPKYLISICRLCTFLFESVMYLMEKKEGTVQVTREMDSNDPIVLTVCIGVGQVAMNFYWCFSSYMLSADFATETKA